jgi:hypothetical protein
MNERRGTNIELYFLLTKHHSVCLTVNVNVNVNG